MKLNPNWVKEVQRVATERMDVALTHDQARAVIETESELRRELVQCRGSLNDTASRDLLIQCVVEAVMEGTELTVKDELSGMASSSWHWPMYGSSKRYREHFFTVFPATARRRGFALGPSWGTKREHT